MTIDRPGARNAIDRATAEGIAAAMDRLDGDDALQVGILTGAGGYFCAGMDLKAFAAGEPVHAGDRGFAGIVERPPETPLIAAVEAYAVGGGATRIRLDTRSELVEARALYARHGYREIPAFTSGPYAQHWFEKALAGRVDDPAEAR